MEVQKYQSKQQLPSVIKRLLEKRGYTPKQMDEFFSWDLNKLPDITQMKDMDKASQRIIQAMENQQKIGIYGDYDVDGTTSCALLYHFFQMLNYQVELFQPSRFVEGYGLHLSSIDKAVEEAVDVLITVDCGITNNEAAIYAKEKSIDLIITDHHTDANSEMPPAYAIINPNRRDEPKDSPLRALAGVGVAFALCWNIKKLLHEKNQDMPSLYPLLPFVACGTICDLAKLNDINLRLTRHGLKAMTQSKYPIFQAYLSQEEKNLAFIPSEKMSFHLGPMINSKGRLEHPEMALKALIAKDIPEAREYLAHLEISNRERKFVQKNVYQKAKEQVLNLQTDKELTCSIVYQENWHEGVIGIVASKLVENFKVPAIVFTNAEEEGVIKASARSAGELNLFQLLNDNKDLFIKFGGHKAAAGLSMRKENYHKFKSRITEQLKNISPLERTTQKDYDIELKFEEITPELTKSLNLLEPFGMGNPKPVFQIKDAYIDSYKILKDQHIKWALKNKKRPHKLQGISFNYLGKWKAPHPEELFRYQEQDGLSIKFTLGINRFNGKEYMQVMVEELSLEL